MSLLVVDFSHISLGFPISSTFITPLVNPIAFKGFLPKFLIYW